LTGTPSKTRSNPCLLTKNLVLSTQHSVLSTIFFGFDDDIFKITPLAIDINDTRALHATELARDALRNMGKIVAASRIALLGASYREDVGIPATAARK
jgi:hypothetical protein